MAKDPAVLFFIDKWLLATKEMKPDCKCWYHCLILHQYDKKSLPNDLEELANLADVRVSEFERFKQVFEEVLKHKFKLNEDGRLVNDFAMEIITNREQFKDKRSNSGKMSYFARFMRKICNDENIIQFVLKNTDFNTLDTKNQQMLEQVFKQTSELYISVSTNTSVSVDTFNTIVSKEEDEEKKEDDFDEEFEDLKVELIKLLASAFNFNTPHFKTEQYSISRFVHTKIRTESDYNHFTEQYRNYKEYKKISNELEHSFRSFLGTPKEAFEDSHWNDENWGAKIEQFNLKNQKKTKSENIADVFGEALNNLKNGHSTL